MSVLQPNFSLTRAAVDRPITSLMASGIVILLGWISFTRLAIDLMPDVNFPTLSIVTIYSGAGPEEVETLITRPIEQVVASVSGVERINSESMEGSSNIRIRFNWGTNLDEATNELRQQLDRIRQRLPEGIDPPYVRKYDIADSPIIYLGLQSELSGQEITSLAERVILPRLEQIDGVARVSLRGREVREIQIQLDRGQMEARGIGVNQIISTLKSSNITQPAGDLQRGDTRILVRNRGEYLSLEQIRSTVIRNENGAVVRMGDVAEVIDGLQEKTELTRVNGQPALMVYIFKQAGANTITVSDSIREAVASLNEELLQAELTIRQDKSDFIREAIQNIQDAAYYGMLLATIVLMLFLNDWRSTIIIGVAMPFSVIATFSLIYFQGFTLNIVSFGGLALGIGLLVDNSIVVLESIYCYRENGHASKEAAILGTQEVAGAIVASTLTTLIVFLPLIFVEGMTGVLLHQLAWVVSFSLCCSLLISLTITPVMAAYWLKSQSGPAKIPVWRKRIQVLNPLYWLRIVSERIIQLLLTIYEHLLRFSLQHPFVIGGTLCLFVSLAFGRIPLIGTEFMPQTDEGVVSVTITMSPGITLNRLSQQAIEAESRILAVTPERLNLAGFIGGDADDADRWNRIYYRVRLVPRDQRLADSEEIRSRIEQALQGIPGCRLSVRLSSDQILTQTLSRNGQGRFAVLIRGHDLETLKSLAEQVTTEMKQTAGFINAEVALADARPELGAFVDRLKASQLDVSVQDVGQVLETTLRGTRATIYRDQGEEIPVIVRFREQDRRGEQQLDQVSVTSFDGRQIPLKNLVHFQNGQAPLTIERFDQQRCIIATADLENRELGEAVADLSAVLRRIPTPPSYTLTISGDWEEQQRSFTALQHGFVLALILMYMIMASQFESLIDPLLILLTVPLAGIGVIAVLIGTETTLNVQSFIGIIVLSGIVVNNAIVVVDYVRQLRLSSPGTLLSELIEQACIRRFRPILMTTLTTLLAMFPVALGWGDGGELQAPMARVVIAGLISGTLTSLLAIPILYNSVHLWLLTFQQQAAARHTPTIGSFSQPTM